MKNVTVRDEWRKLNLQISNQLRANGVCDHKGKIVKSLDDMPQSEWKEWITELINYRDSLTELV